MGLFKKKPRYAVRMLNMPNPLDKEKLELCILSPYEHRGFKFKYRQRGTVDDSVDFYTEEDYMLEVGYFYNEIMVSADTRLFEGASFDALLEESIKLAEQQGMDIWTVAL